MAVRLAVAAAVLVAAGVAFAGADRLVRLFDPDHPDPGVLEADDERFAARIALLGERQEFKHRLVNDLIAGRARLAEAAAELREVIKDDTAAQVPLANTFADAPPGRRAAGHLLMLIALELPQDSDRRRAVLPRLLDEFREAFGDTREVVAAIEQPARGATAGRPYHGGRWGRWGRRF